MKFVGPVSRSNVLIGVYSDVGVWTQMVISCTTGARSFIHHAVALLECMLVISPSYGNIVTGRIRLASAVVDREARDSDS